MKIRSHQAYNILQTSLYHVMDCQDNKDEMSVFKTFFRDEQGSNDSQYYFARLLDNQKLPKFRADVPFLKNFKATDINVPNADRKA
jgi:hypothetical protein